MTLILDTKYYTIATAFVASSGDMRSSGFKSLDPIVGREGRVELVLDIALQ